MAICLISILCISQNTAIASAESQGNARLVIDNQNVYAGMKSSYARGYVPKVDGKRAVVVLPLIAKGKVSGNRITAAPKLGESENVPFVCKNYEKSVRLCRHKIGKNGRKKSCYLVVFSLALKRERYNGTYPVNIAVTAEDGAGNEICQDFTVYVTIRNGKKPGEEGASSGSGSSENPPVLFAPKVLVDSYHFSKKKVACGEKFRAKITLRNTSKKEAVRNMLVTVSPEEQVELLSKSAGVYVERLAAGKTCQVSFVFKINGGAPAGQYGIGVAMEYADEKANAYTAQGTVKVSAYQRAKIGIDPVSVPREMKLGETMELQTQVMNLGRGRLRNVRAVMEAEGLSSSGSAYLGDIEAGASMSGTMELTAEGLSGDSLYGTAQGKVTFYYEDEAGKELTEEQTFETAILSPIEKEENEVEEDSGQWWIIMSLIGAFLEAAAVACFARRWGAARRGGGGVNEE